MSLTTTAASSATNPASNPASTIVLQSHRQPLPHPWIETALTSVRSWAEGRGYSYRFIDDALFDELTPTERSHCRAQPVVASDLARLRWCQRLLNEGAMRVVWCDADTLVIDGDALELSPASCAFGRELWLQPDTSDSKASSKLKLYKKIHNAFMQFTAGNPVLDFYAYAAARLIDNHAQQSAAPMVAQLAGPKFLTHLHNVLSFDVVESAQVVSPPLAQALLHANSEVLARYVGAAAAPAAAFNLCCSEVQRGTLTNQHMQDLIELLMTRGARAFGSS